MPKVDDVDQALLGPKRFGKWRILSYILICLGVNIPGTWHMLSIVFIGAEPVDYHCQIPNVDRIHDYIPYDERDEHRISRCKMYVVQGSGTPSVNETTPCTDGWSYYGDTGDTIVTDWDLVCDQNYLMETSQMLFGVGVMVGALVFPSIADHVGRKPVFIACQMGMVASGVALALSENIQTFTTVRFIMGAMREGLGLSGIVLACELFPAADRAVAGVALQFFWSLAWFLLTLMAYFLRHWRHLQVALTIPPILTITYVWLITESVPWLMAKGNNKKAEEILNMAIKMDGLVTAGPSPSGSGPERGGQQIPLAEIAREATPSGVGRNLLNKGPGQNYTLRDICRSKRMAVYAGVMCLLWFINIVVYYGLSLSTSLLAGDRYLNFFLSGLVEVPAYAVTIVALQKFGRRWPLFAFHLIAGLGLLVVVISRYTASESVSGHLETIFSMVGKFGITASLAVLVLYANEIYPTTLRNTGFGLASTSGRLGGILAPFSLYIAKQHPWLPGVVFAVLAMGAALVGLVLPETKDRPLPQTMEDVETWQSICFKKRTSQ